MFTAEGRWHVIAWCHLVDGERDFRIDRIRVMERTGEHFEKRDPMMQPGQAFQPVAGAFVAWAWLAESLGGVQLAGAAIVLAAIVLAQTAR